MLETYRPEKYKQLMFSTFKLDRESEICRDPFSYLRNLTDTAQTNQQDKNTVWLQGNGFSISLKSDEIDEIGELEPELPFIAIAIWPKNFKVSPISEKFHIGPKGTIKFSLKEEEQPESVLDSYSLPELTEIKWKDDRHKHSAKVALFVESNIPNNHSS